MHVRVSELGCVRISSCQPSTCARRCALRSKRTASSARRMTSTSGGRRGATRSCCQRQRARGTASWTRSRLACGSFTVRLAASAICRANNRRHAQLAPRSHPPLMSSLSLERNASATTTRKRRERRHKRSSSRGAPRRTTCPLRGGKQAAAVVASLVSQSGLLRSRWASKRPRTRRALPFGSLH